MNFSENFSEKEKAQYLRHFSLPEIGISGQSKLKNASVLCIGAGGLGSPVLLYLTSAGIGRIGIVDDDVVDASNLQRQILFNHNDIGKKKAKVAKEKLNALNPNIKIEAIGQRFTRQNAEDILQNYDILVDGSDNFPTRFLCNDICVKLKKTNVQAAIYRFEGTLSVFASHRQTPCYRCIFPELPPPNSVPNCATAGVLGILPGIIGSMQATEAIKIIIGRGDVLFGKMLTYDALRCRLHKINLAKDDNCKICSKEMISLPNDYDINYCHGNEENEFNNGIKNIEANELKTKLNLVEKSFTLIDVREDFEFMLYSIEGAKNFPLSILQNLPEKNLKEVLQKFTNAKNFEDLKDSEICVICAKGIRSQQAAKTFQELGCNSVINVLGGMSDWHKIN